MAGEDIREGRADVPSALFQIEADARAALNIPSRPSVDIESN
jgi:hypothetical protein